MEGSSKRRDRDRFLAKDRDGSVSGIEVGGALNQLAAAFAEFEGASSGLFGEDDLQEAAAALEPGTSAAVLVWEGSSPYDQPEPAPAYAEPAPAPAAPQADMIQQLKDLAALHEQGVLTDEEFQAKKARVLGG